MGRRAPDEMVMEALEEHFRNLQQIIEDIGPGNVKELASAEMRIAEIFEGINKAYPADLNGEDTDKVNRMIQESMLLVTKKRKMVKRREREKSFKAQGVAVKGKGEAGRTQETKGTAEFRALLRKVEDGLSVLQPEIMKPSLRDSSAQQRIEAKAVENELLSKMDGVRYNYHNKRHAQDVVDTATEIAKGEGVSDRELELLRIAAAGHDVGFTVKYKENEPEGARITAEVMKKNGFSLQEIKFVEDMIIYGTTVPQKPATKLQEILADADVANLGRRDFFERGEELRNEVGIANMMDWYKSSKKLLDGHEFFTGSAKKLFDAGQEVNRAETNRRIKELERS